MDSVQILLIIVLVVSTVFITVVGIQLAIVLFEAQKILKHINKMTKGLDEIGQGLKHGIGEATGFLNGFKTVMKVIDIYKDAKSEKSKK
jgi:hypothetical protein